MTGGKLLQDAMGKIDERYIAEVIAFPHERAIGRKRIVSYATAAACFCLIICAAVLVFRAPITMNDTAITDTILPSDYDGLIWAQDQSDKSDMAYESYSSSTSFDSLVSIHRNGWNMSGELYFAMENADPDALFAVLVTRDYDYNDMMRFSYGGKTRGEWEVEREILRTHQHKLGELSKEGLWLQYGEALYTTGTPDGEKWAKELYEERVNFYGAYFLEQYIINGTLQSDQIAQEMKNNEARLQEISAVLVKLEDAYTARNAEEDYQAFAKKGVRYTLKSGRLYIFVTPKELSKLRVRGKSGFFLSLANRRVFEAEDQLPSARVDEDVTGFACEKISFYTDGVIYNHISTDHEMIEATQYLLERWQYTTDFLHISIYADPRLDEEQLASMGYRSVYFSTYSDLILLNVPMEELNLTAIRDLSLLPQVSEIHISPPLTVDHCG